MLDTSEPLGVANDPVDSGSSATGEAPDATRTLDFRFPGLIAWAICAVGLAFAMFALVTGQMWMTMAGLGVAVMGPSLGLALVAHAQRGAYNIALPAHD